jgi:hypothetical protein
LEEDVWEAVRSYRMEGEDSGRAILISGRVRADDGTIRAGSAGGPSDIFHILPSEDLCAGWVRRLRMQIMTWKLMRERVTAPYARRPLSEAADAFLVSLLLG